MNGPLEIKRIDSENEMWLAQRLYVASFPENERREVSEWVRLSFEKPQFHNNIILYNGEFAGIITYWDLGDFAYVEHFAVNVALRGHGIGGKALDMVCEKLAKPVVLEVEPPVGEMEQRRIGFYRRHGFSLSERRYVQPPYRDGGEGVELKIMWRGKKEIHDIFENVVDSIYNNVYNFEGRL